MNNFSDNWVATIPMANEAPDFAPFINLLKQVMDEVGGGHVIFIVDHASKDNTRELCENLGKCDPRFQTLWAPENHNVVDAYLRGFKEAITQGYDIIIEMDGGLSHDPRAITAFLRALHEGNDCAFGSRYINGGSMADSPWKRRLLSKGGSILARLLLGAKLRDMTSGYEAFRRPVLEKLLAYPLLSKAHFYQTEVRYLLRYERSIEVPIHYRAPSPRVSQNALKNAFKVLGYYTWRRITGRAVHL